MMSIVKLAGVLSIAAAAACVGQVTNTIPFSDSFEAYDAGITLTATNGWSGGGTVTHLTYSYNSASNGYPVAGSHTNVLDVSGGATNDIDGASSTGVWVDSIIRADSFWPGPGHPAVDSNPNVCVYVNTNGNLVAGHTQYGGSNLTWTVFDSSTIASGSWNRVTFQLNYLTHTYSILLNGVSLEHANGRAEPDGTGSGGPWFPMIGTFPFAGVALDGEAFIDDLVVAEDAPYASVSVADAGNVAEGDSGTAPALFAINLSSSSSVPVTVDYTTVDGTAVAGTDYIAASGTVVIPAGVSQTNIAVQIVGDTDVESDVDFTLELSSPVNGLLADASGAAVIDDDDIVVSADLVVSGSTLKIVDGAPNNPSGGVTNFFSPTETVDWVVWNTASLTPAERKSGVSALLVDFSSSQSWAASIGNRIFTAWEDGTVVPAATNFSGLAMSDVGEGVPYTAMDFSVDLDAVTEGSYYKLRICSTDKRSNSSVKYWDADSSSYQVASSETDNDAADLRIHEIIISNVTANATLPMQMVGERTGIGYPVVLGGMDLILVGSLLPPPAESEYDGWAGDYSLGGTNALLTADADGSGFNNLFEYAFGGDPTNAAVNGTNPTHELDGTEVEYIYLRRTDTNLLYTVQIGTNLVSGSWSTNGVTETSAGSAGPDYESVTNRIPTAGTENGYVRVRVDVL